MELSKPFRRKTTILLLAAAAALALSPARRAVACWFDPIIFDPSAFGEHVREAAELGQQIGAAAVQIQEQLLQLAHLDSSLAPDDIAIVAGVQQQLDSSLYAPPSAADQLNASYPMDMSNINRNQYEADESTWAGNERQAIAENRQVENQVYRGMATTTGQVQSIVDASNSAPGETAAIQAHDDLLAVASGELAKLQALKVARSRLKTQEFARRQSELSYAATQRSQVRADWDNPPPPAGTLVDPFQN